MVVVVVVVQSLLLGGDNFVTNTRPHSGATTHSVARPRDHHETNTHTPTKGLWKEETTEVGKKEDLLCTHHPQTELPVLARYGLNFCWRCVCKVDSVPCVCLACVFFVSLSLSLSLPRDSLSRDSLSRDSLSRSLSLDRDSLSLSLSIETLETLETLSLSRLSRDSLETLSLSRLSRDSL